MRISQTGVPRDQSNTLSSSLCLMPRGSAGLPSLPAYTHVSVPCWILGMPWLYVFLRPGWLFLVCEDQGWTKKLPSNTVNSVTPCKKHTLRSIDTLATFHMVRIWWVTASSHAEPISLAFIYLHCWSTWSACSLAITGPLIPGFLIFMNSWITTTLHTIVCMCVLQNGERRVTELEVFKEALLKRRAGSWYRREESHCV